MFISPRLMATAKAQADNIRLFAAGKVTEIAVLKGWAPSKEDAPASEDGRDASPSEMEPYAKGRADIAWAKAGAQKDRPRPDPKNLRYPKPRTIPEEARGAAHMTASARSTKGRRPDERDLLAPNQLEIRFPPAPLFFFGKERIPHTARAEDPAMHTEIVAAEKDNKTDRPRAGTALVLISFHHLDDKVGMEDCRVRTRKDSRNTDSSGPNTSITIMIV